MSSTPERRRARRDEKEKKRIAEAVLKNRSFRMCSKQTEKGERMDTASFLELVHKKMERAVLDLDQAKKGLEGEDRVVASRIEATMILAIAVSFMESCVDAGPDRDKVVEMAHEWSKRIHFVDMGGRPIEKVEESLIVKPSRRGPLS